MDTIKKLEQTLDRLDEMHNISKNELEKRCISTSEILQIVQLLLDIENQKIKVITWLHVDREDA